MSNDLISRSALFNTLFVHNGKVCPNNDIDNFPITFNAKDIKEAIRNAPTAYDVDKVVDRLEEAEYEDECYNCNLAVEIEEAKRIVKSGGIE